MPPPLGKAIAQAKKLIQEAVTLIGETLKAHPELATTPAERRLTLGSPETPERPSEAVIAPQRKLRKPLLIKKLRITLL